METIGLTADVVLLGDDVESTLSVRSARHER